MRQGSWFLVSAGIAIFLLALMPAASATVLTIDNLMEEGALHLTADPVWSGAAGPEKSDHEAFAVIDENLDPADAAALKARIRNVLYAFSYDETDGAWYARNRDTGIMFAYTNDGTAGFYGAESLFGLALSGIGRDDAISTVSLGEVQAEGRQLNITRPGSTEWYQNNDNGMEQGLTLADRPEGTGPVQVRFTISGNSSFTPGYGTKLAVTGADGNPLFTYTGLSATDATGRELPALLATDGTNLSWIVDDTGAAYPVTIDPVVVPASAATATFPGAAENDCFGYSVALSSDGSRVLVGAKCVSTSAGAAYLFKEPTAGWSGTTSALNPDAKFTGSAGNNWFGYSVALSSNGTRALVGAQYVSSQAGAAYLFKEPTAGWSGTTPAVAANATFNGSAAGNYFGYSVALSSDGTRALVGAYGVSSSTGAAYLFKEPVAGWSGTTISASAANATFAGDTGNDRFGNSVALSSNGTRALVGAYYASGGGGVGAAYLFKEPTAGWSGTTPAVAANATFTGDADSDWFGESVALSSNGTRVLVGAEYVGGNAGAAYLFKEPTAGWSGTTISASAANATFTAVNPWDQFGNSVSLSSDGTRVLVGAYVPSVAYLFKEPTAGWSGTTTSASDANATFTGSADSDQFGWSVALSSDGTCVLVGAKAVSPSDAGAAYLYNPPYVTLAAGGETTGTAWTTVNGLTLTPNGTLTDIDLYLGTNATTVTGTPVKSGIASLPVSVATTVDGIDLHGKSAGTYYLVACENRTTTVIAATGSAAYTVTAPPPPTVLSISPSSGSNSTSQSVTLTGTHFNTTSVTAYLNRAGTNTSLNAVAGTSTAFNGTVPASIPASSYRVYVENGDGQSATNASVTYTVMTSTPTPTPTYTNIGDDTSGDSGGRDSSYIATSPGTAVGQPMTFTINEPVTTGMPWAVIAVTIVPEENLGSTELVVSDARGTSSINGRNVAGTFSIVPVAVNPDAIGSGTVTFAVAQSWLSRYGLAPGNIVLLHNHDGAWEECPTMFDHESGDVCYFTATTPGFSYFAIASRQNTTPAGVTATDPAGTVAVTGTVLPDESVSITDTGNVPAGPASAAPTGEPAVETTAGPSGEPRGSSGIPTLYLAAGIAGIAVLGIAAVYIRRWLIRRQNPALFREYR